MWFCCVFDCAFSVGFDFRFALLVSLLGVCCLCFLAVLLVDDDVFLVWVGCWFG